MKHSIVIAAISLTACTSMGGGGLAGMSAEHITASAKIKDASIACTRATTIYGSVTSLWVNLDKGVIPNGGVTVSPDCASVTINNAPAKP